MGKASPPQPPDPNVTSAAQTTSNVNTAVANAILGNVNQTTPTGSLTFNQIGTQTVDGREIPRWEAISTLSPAQQRLYDSYMGASLGTADLANRYVGRISDATSRPFSYDGAPDAPQYDAAFRQKTRDDIIARNQGNMDRDRAALESRLSNQGIGIGSEAWSGAMDDYGRSVNDFRLGADIQSGQEAERAFGMGAQTRDRWITEQANLRNQPINEVSALLGTGPGVRGPEFVPTQMPQIAGTDVAGNINNAYQGQLAAWQQQQQSQGGALGGLMGLLGTVGGAALMGPLGGAAMGGIGGLMGRGARGWR